MCVQLHLYQSVYARVYVCICRRKHPSSDTIHLSYDTGPFTSLELAKQNRLAVQ